MSPMAGGGYDAEGKLLELGKTQTKMEQRLQDMNDRLRTLGCDPSEVAQSGNQIAGNSKDPTSIALGGNGAAEICGDGIDNDGDGLQDEDCAGSAGGNIVITVFDSGSAKDDSFRLSVSSKGTLGVTPPGAAASFPVSLGKGSYVATINVILAPDNVGTFTATVQEGKNVIAALTGAPAQGGSATLAFTVGAAMPASLPPVNMNKVTLDEIAERMRRGKKK